MWFGVPSIALLIFSVSRGRKDFLVGKGGHWWTKVGIGGRKDFFGVYLFGCSFGSRLTKYVWFCQSSV